MRNVVMQEDNLSEEQLRRLYLRKLAKGEIQGPPTGYPDQDMVWLKNHSEQSIIGNLPKNTMYEFLYENNKNHMSDIAIKYYGVSITYKELFDNIDKNAKALVYNGIQENDVVGICSPTTPESIYLFYAINKIGAIANLIDVRKDNEQICRCLNVEGLNVAKTKMLFVLDSEIDRISSILDQTEVKNIISLSPVFSLEKYKQVLADPKQFLTNIKKHLNKTRRYDFYDEFIESGVDLDSYFVPEYKENKESFIVYTSGSTAISKAVVLTNDTANTRVWQYMNNDMPYTRGETYLDIIPIFLAFGAIVGIHLPLVMGLSDEVIAAFDPDNIYKLMKSKKPEHMTLTPSSFIELINSKLYNKLNLESVLTWGCGGDGMNASEEIIINNSLSFQGSKHKVNNGYGGSEIGAPFSTQKEGVTVPGSVGIPLPHNNVMIIDHFTGEKLMNYQVGDICMIVDYPMIGYVGNEDLTSETRFELENGQYAIILRDAGYVDGDGNLFVKGRFEDAIYTDDDIIWPVDIENLIYSTNLVKICAVAQDNSEMSDFNIYVCLKDGVSQDFFESSLENIFKIHKNSLNYNISFLKNMYLTSSGKIDRKKLKEISKKNKMLEKV